MNTENIHSNNKLILPDGNKDYLQIRTLEFPKPTKLETDLHIVSTEAFSPTIEDILNLRGFALNEVESPLISTKAVATINFDKYSMIDAYKVFQKCLLDKRLFGEYNEFQGYMEFEGWTPEIDISWSEYNNPQDINFELPQLEPKPVIGNNFKRADVHLVVSKIDKRLEQKLLNLGFYYADFTNKEGDKNIEGDFQSGLHRALTIQNTQISNTNKIKKALQNYIQRFGGVEGKIFVEPVLLYVRTKDNSVPPCSDVRI